MIANTMKDNVDYTLQIPSEYVTINKWLIILFTRINRMGLDYAIISTILYFSLFHEPPPPPPPFPSPTTISPSRTVGTINNNTGHRYQVITIQNDIIDWDNGYLQNNRQ